MLGNPGPRTKFQRVFLSASGLALNCVESSRSEPKIVDLGENEVEEPISTESFEIGNGSCC